MDSWEQDNIIKRLNDDFFITIEDPSYSYPPEQDSSDHLSKQDTPDNSDEHHPEDPNQSDPERSQSYIHQTKSSNEDRTNFRSVRFSLGALKVQFSCFNI
jgi:hypothetical protein